MICIYIHQHQNVLKIKNTTPKSIISKAIKEDLSAIAITDHNTGEWIDKIKEEAEKRNFTVFPGVEITSETGIHILAIFDIDKKTSDINHLLSCIGIKPSDYGKSTTVSTLSHIKIIEKIDELGAICILPHIDDIKGAFEVLTGNPRIRFFTESKYLAVETENGELPEKLKKIDRKIVAIKSSDNPDPNDKTKHSIEGIGKRYTFFKLDEHINLEGIKQCLYDPEVRIKISKAYKEESFPKIISIKASDGFLNKQNIEFHSGLNSIIGGKGVGKSLIIEFLRFVLDQESINESIIMDHKGKLEKKLGYDNFIECEIELKSGTRYKIKKTLGDDETLICTNVKTGEQYNGEINKLFPILAYSQTEVIKIAEDSEAQLRLIDSFIDITTEKNKLKSLVSKLNKNDNSFIKSINASSEKVEIEKEINTINSTIKEYGNILNKDKKGNKIFEEFKNIESNKLAFDDQLNMLNEINTLINEFQENINNISFENLSEKKKLLSVIKTNENKINEYHDKINITISTMKNDYTKLNKSLEIKYNNLIKKYNLKEKAYKESLENEKEKKDIMRKRKTAVSNKADLSKKLVNLRELSSKYNKLKQERKNLMSEYIKYHDDIFEKRQKIYNELTKKSNLKLNLKIEKGLNRKKYYKQLQELVKGIGIRKEQLKMVSQSLLPNEFVNLVLNKNIDKIAEKTSITDSNAEKIVNKIFLDSKYNELLELEYTCFPEDEPVIEYKINKKEYAPLAELSVGQKCTALLIIALCEGENPVIIDQPEDALDITTVWEDISKKTQRK